MSSSVEEVLTCSPVFFVCFFLFVFLPCISSKIGEEQSPEDAEDGPPELLVSFCFVLLSLSSSKSYLSYCGNVF